MARASRATQDTSDSEAALPILLNGAVRVVAHGPEFRELDGALRGIALSDSPVLIEGGSAEDQKTIVERVHALSPRRMLPIEWGVPFEVVRKHYVNLSQIAAENRVGTWALSDVASWPKEEQLAFSALLTSIDEGRLTERFQNQAFPRILVWADGESANRIEPQLLERISFFRIVVRPKKK